MESNLRNDVMEEDLQAQASLPGAAEISPEQERFEVELEFVQCLASPSYLHFLAQNEYFDSPDFLKYVDYLQYWTQPEYVRFIVFPHALYFLRLLQEKAFREALKRADYTLMMHQQQGYTWQYGRALKVRKPNEPYAPLKSEIVRDTKEEQQTKMEDVAITL